MDTMGLALAIFGLAVGVFWIYAYFTSNRLTELMRIDALLMPKPSPKMRVLNLLAGIAAIVYYGYTLLKGYNIIGP